MDLTANSTRDLFEAGLNEAASCQSYGDSLVGSTVFKVLFQKSGVFWLQRRVREGEIVGKTACAIDQERHWSDGSEQEEAISTYRWSLRLQLH